MNKLWLLVLLIGLSVSHVNAAEKSGQGAGLKATLERNIPGSQFTSVVESPIKGLYEAVNATNGTIIYATLDGNYVVSGYIYDRKTGQNLTTMSIMSGISDNQTVVFAPKNNKVNHTITVFTDTTCGYCRKLHQEIPILNDAGIKVRYMLMPRAGLGSPSHKTLQSIWCADNQQSAMNSAKAGGDVPAKTCDNPIEKHLSVASALGVGGTPYIVTDKGDVINGYRPAQALIAQLKASDETK